MSEAPWLTIVGLGEDGLDGLSPASRDAIDQAEIVMGAPRHLQLLVLKNKQLIEWPVPFSDGLKKLEEFRGQKTVALASGDPFWFGAGTSISRLLDPEEWRALPNLSIFSLAASHLGWPLEETVCIGLHAAPFSRLRPQLSRGGRAIVTLRDGAACSGLADWLSTVGFGESVLHVLEALGGPRERRRTFVANNFSAADVAHPVSVGIEMVGDGLSQASGLSDDFFETDGQLTKRAVRAITLSSLAPRPGEMLWDLGAGSGSISIEWLLSHPSTQAVAVERDATRARTITENAERLGQDRLSVVQGSLLDALHRLPKPGAIFVGGGLSTDLLEAIEDMKMENVRLVANAVTLENEMVLISYQQKLGGDLMKIDISDATSIGRFRGWKARYPVVQWSVTL